MEEKRKNKERMIKAKRQKTDFYKNKSCFFGIIISDNDIEISVLDSLEAYQTKGEQMKHCVFKASITPRAILLSSRFMTTKVTISRWWSFH